MTKHSGAAHPRLRAVMRAEIHAVPWVDPGDTRSGLEETTDSILRACHRIEAGVAGWLADNAVALLRVSLGIIFLWFGALKFAPGFSPAEGLAGATMAKLTFGWLDPKVAIAILAVWETAVGLALIFGVRLRIALALLLVQMAGTLTPLALFPAITFTRFPFVPTMEGQYILKNLVLISAAIVIGATLRRGGLAGHCSGCRGSATGRCRQVGG
jgi:uncharacterized membrane protein YphA (DoxX/SURF4 family)